MYNVEEIFGDAIGKLEDLIDEANKAISLINDSEPELSQDAQDDLVCSFQDKLNKIKSIVNTLMTYDYY